MTSPDKMKIVYRKTSSLKPYEGNARVHPPEQIEQIRASIREFGFRNPILLKDDGKTIGAGHGRWEAAKAEGMATVPTITLTGLTDAQWRAYVIIDNQSALLADWDWAKLNIEVASLKVDDFDISLLGFDSFDMKNIYMADVPGNGDEQDEESTPEPPATPVSKPGDVWLLGGHRLTCGDCTVAETVDLALGGAKPNLMVTDPPYGVKYDPEWRHEAAAKGLNGFSAKRDGKVENDDRADWTDAWRLFPGNIAYVWHAGVFASAVQASLERTGLIIRSQIIWAKDSFSISRGDYHWQHEPCWYVVRKGKAGDWHGDRSQSTLWKINKRDGNDTGGHGTQKPIECMKRPIENNSKPGDLVYEPFCGSGTTIIAAEITSRKCLAIELNPAYVDVGVRRWQDYTGKTAVHAETGLTFAQEAAQRLSKGAA